MIWNNKISFSGLDKIYKEWRKTGNICDPPIPAQYALDLIFKTLIDDKKHFPYLTIIPESVEQTNSIMLEIILKTYCRKYRKYLRRKKKNEK